MEKKPVEKCRLCPAPTPDWRQSDVCQGIGSDSQLGPTKAKDNKGHARSKSKDKKPKKKKEKKKPSGKKKTSDDDIKKGKKSKIKSSIEDHKVPVAPPKKSTDGGEGPKIEPKAKKMRKTSDKDNCAIISMLYPCTICERKFSPSSLKDHRDKCKDMKAIEPIVRSPLLDRWKGTRLEQFVDKLCFLTRPPNLNSYKWEEDRINMYEAVNIQDFDTLSALQATKFEQEISTDEALQNLETEQPPEDNQRTTEIDIMN